MDKNTYDRRGHGMALLSECMGCDIADPARDLAVQRISGRRKKKERTGISKAVPGDDTGFVSGT